MSKRIIDYDIIPYFKRNDYYRGLNSGADAIFEVLQGEYYGTRQSTSSNFPFGIIIILFFVFIIFIIAISNSRNGGGNGGRGAGTAASILEAIILSNMGRGSYKRSSGGFGGFGSGSSGGSFGGGFGGGGASGGW